jgi:drug/metabolite transporter (DMT)-like permease
MNEQHVPWREWVPEFVLLALLWGSSFLFMREGAQAFGAFPTAWVRITLAAIMLTPVLIWRKELPVLHAHWRPAALSGLLNSGVPFACYAYALMHITTGMSSILNATTPLFGALIAWAWLGDKLNTTRALGLALGFTGVVLLASDVPGGIWWLWLSHCRLLAGHVLLRHCRQLHQALFTKGALHRHNHRQFVGCQHRTCHSCPADLA